MTRKQDRKNAAADEILQREHNKTMAELTPEDRAKVESLAKKFRENLGLDF